MFGRENLCACVASFYGAGLTAGYGMSNAAKRVERSGGQSTRIGQGGGASEQLKRIEDMKTAKDISDIPTAGDQYDSAEKIYRFLAAQQNGMSALKPFSINDLDYTMGWVSGASVDAAIGAGTYYLADARNLFKGATALNVKTEATLIGASLGSMIGFWRVKKWYSLWTELSAPNARNIPSRPIMSIRSSANGSRRNIPTRSSLIASPSRIASLTRSPRICRSTRRNTASRIPIMRCSGPWK